MYPITSGRFSSFGRIVFYTTKLLKCTSPQELQFNGGNPFTFQYEIWCGDSWALFSINLPASWASFSQSDEKCWKSYLNWKKKKKCKTVTKLEENIFFAILFQNTRILDGFKFFFENWFSRTHIHLVYTNFFRKINCFSSLNDFQLGLFTNTFHKPTILIIL